MLVGLLQEKHIIVCDLPLTMVLFSQVTEDNTNRFPGAQKYGGWIVDNCPVIRDLWMAFIEKEIVPDLVISFTDGENNGW